MNDVDRLILEAWEKLGPGIMGDSDELNRRLARRRMKILTRPMRAWCLAVRASDRRITPAHWVISPEHAMDLNHPEHPYEPIEHEVIIRPEALRKYCRPVRTDSWGELVEDVCKQLGVDQAHLLYSRYAGKFTERYVKGLGGRRGKPVPLIHSWETLDPSGTGFFRKPDALWGSLWGFLPDMVPDDFEQTVIRRPRFKRKERRRRKGIDGVVRLDAKGPADHVYSEDMRFAGWRWVCPGCKKEVRKIYYPLAAESVFDFLGYDPGSGRKTGRSACATPKKFLRYDVEKVEPPAPTFACCKCHRVGWGTRTTEMTWNMVVSHLTRGMLYGHEVQKPQWYRSERKHARHRKLGRVAVKREAVFKRLMNGWSMEQIARDLLISKNGVIGAIHIICRQEGVKNRRELAAKLGWKIEQPLNGWEKHLAGAKEHEEAVLPLILEGLSRVEIVRRTGLSASNVHQALERLYKKHGLGKGEGKRALGRKFGIELGRFGKTMTNEQCAMRKE